MTCHVPTSPLWAAKVQIFFETTKFLRAFSAIISIFFIFTLFVS
jgi:hypothetical protein